MARAPRVELVEGEEMVGEAVGVRRRTSARARDARVSVSRDGRSSARNARERRDLRVSDAAVFDARRRNRVGAKINSWIEGLIAAAESRLGTRPALSLTQIPKPRQNPRPGAPGRHLRTTPHASDARGCPPRRFAHVQPRALDARASHRRRGRWDAIPRRSPPRRRVAAAAAPSTTPTTSGRRASPPSPARSPTMR